MTPEQSLRQGGVRQRGVSQRKLRIQQRSTKGTWDTYREIVGNENPLLDEMIS
jgi:hypothetical protein